MSGAREYDVVRIRGWEPAQQNGVVFDAYPGTVGTVIHTSPGGSDWLLLEVIVPGAITMDCEPWFIDVPRDRVDVVVPFTGDCDEEA